MVFLVALFLIKNGLLVQKAIEYVGGGQKYGLTYNNNTTVADLINKDTDGDGIPDWEETLYGLDPAKRETTPGTPDISVINKLRAENSELGSSGSGENTENLTETDKFSRELFSTVATLNQTGTINQSTAEQIGSSLTDKIKNYAPRKIFIISDIKTTDNETTKTIKIYADSINLAFKDSNTDYSVMDVLKKFIVDENNVDPSVLAELDPIIKKMSTALGELEKIIVPKTFADLHLVLLNSMERVIENINDIKLYETDSLLSLAAINKYNENTTSLQSSIQTISDAISKKLSI